MFSSTNFHNRPKTLFFGGFQPHLSRKPDVLERTQIRIQKHLEPSYFQNPCRSVLLMFERNSVFIHWFISISGSRDIIDFLHAFEWAKWLTNLIKFNGINYVDLLDLCGLWLIWIYQRLIKNLTSKDLKWSNLTIYFITTPCNITMPSKASCSITNTCCLAHSPIPLKPHTTNRIIVCPPSA